MTIDTKNQNPEVNLNPIHRYQMRIVYADTDAGGVVYHARYLDIAERARTEMMFALNLGNYSNMAHENQGNIVESELKPVNFLVVRRTEIDFLRPAKLYDQIDVITYLEKLGRSSIEFRQEIHANNHLLARINIILVWIDTAFRPQRLPQKLRDVFTQAGN